MCHSTWNYNSNGYKFGRVYSLFKYITVYFFTKDYNSNTVVLFKITRPKDREFVVKGMIAGTKDHEIGIANVVLSIPLFEF